jgi:hypothetical protein
LIGAIPLWRVAIDPVTGVFGVCNKLVRRLKTLALWQRFSSPALEKNEDRFSCNLYAVFALHVAWLQKMRI